MKHVSCAPPQTTQTQVFVKICFVQLIILIQQSPRAAIAMTSEGVGGTPAGGQ